MSPPLGIRRLTGWVWSYARRHRPQLVAIGLLTGLTILLSVVRPWPMVFLIDYVLRDEEMPSWVAALVGSLPGSGTPVQLVGWAVAATVLIFLLKWAAEVASKYATVTLTQRMTYDVAGDLFRHLQHLSLRFHANRPVGDTIRRVTKDCSCVAVILREAIIPVFSSVGTMAMMFVIMWQINVTLTLLALVVVPLMVLTFWLYAGPMLERSYREEEADARMYELVERTFSSMPVVQAFSREALNDDQFRRTADLNIAVAVHALSVQLQFRILVGFVTALGTAGILWLGAQEVMAGRMTVGGIVLFLSYLASLYRPIEAVIYTGSTIQSAGGSARRVLDIMAAEREVVERPGAVTLARSRGHVAFDKVAFSYDGARPILQDISLQVEPGETVALVGPTGAGKSTLVSLVPRFFDPSEGRVLLDGHDLRDLRLADLRRQIALVLQEPFLFPLSVAENIAYGRPGAPMEEIEGAARAAHAHEFISQLPDGYDTVLGERGATLSGGERQRLSIARALLMDAPLLILDEPTSSLDVETEVHILAAMRNLMRGRTAFLIAHRLATVRHAARILVLDRGRIAESGTHDALVRLGGLYARYAALQTVPSEPLAHEPAASGEGATS